MSGRDDAPRGRTAAERWAFGIAVAIVVAIVAVVLASWVTAASGPPDVRARQSGPVERAGGAYRVPFEVRNHGGEAAAAVQVVAELTVDGRVEGEGEQSIAFLSGGERESGAFLFPADPADGELSISVASYAHP